MIRFASALPVVAAALALAAAATPLAAATATNLKCNGCVGTKDIGSSAVTGAKIKDGSIGAKDLAKTAKPTGLDYDSSNSGTTIDIAVAIVRSVTLNAPGPGYALVSATGTALLSGSSGIKCSISKDANLDLSQRVLAENGATSSSSIPVAITNVYAVDKGDTQFNLLCTKLSGTATMYDHIIFAVFMPNRY
jgi:hypothetical protein